MTTIIVVAIVALVFFVAISVAAFMTWRQETQMRTDSLKGIEMSLNEVLGEFSRRHPTPVHSLDDFHQDSLDRRGEKRSKLKRSSKKRQAVDEGEDPFSWANREPGIDVTVFRPSDISVKHSEASSEISDEIKGEIKHEPEEESPTIQPETQPTPEIEIKLNEPAGPAEEKANEDKNSDPEKADLSSIDIDDLFDLDRILFEEIEHDKTADYNTGRSGRKYTAEELESLIKE